MEQDRDRLNDTGEDANPFVQLPDELVEEILAYSSSGSPGTRSSVGRVDSRFRRIAQSPHVAPLARHAQVVADEDHARRTGRAAEGVLRMRTRRGAPRTAFDDSLHRQVRDGAHMTDELALYESNALAAFLHAGRFEPDEGGSEDGKEKEEKKD